VVNDVFAQRVGRGATADTLRRHARRPVHAYLLVGPAEAGVHDAVLAFAAALECPAHGCGTCATCRRVLAGAEADVYHAERAGVAWRVEEIREAERVSRRRPLGPGYQVVVIEDVELSVTGAAPCAGALLKSLEEPPERTIFVLGASQLPGGLETVVSRCVVVRLAPASVADVEAQLRAEGVEEPAARDAAAASLGRVERARLLVGDAALAERMAWWRAVPARLGGTPAAAVAVAREAASVLDEAAAPLERSLHDAAERERETAAQFGGRATGRRELEAQSRREQRRFRAEELTLGLSTMTSVYRERLAADLESARDGDVRAEHRVASSLRAIDALLEAQRRLSTTLDEGLLLHDLVLTLSDF
jgi:DNA polymerase III subunit delta'